MLYQLDRNEKVPVPVSTPERQLIALLPGLVREPPLEIGLHLDRKAWSGVTGKHDRASCVVVNLLSSPCGPLVQDLLFDSHGASLATMMGLDSVSHVIPTMLAVQVLEVIAILMRNKKRRHDRTGNL